MSENQIDKELLECFVTEALDCLSQWEKICIEISPTNLGDSLNAIFRVAHNLKGSSRSIGLEAFGQFVHKVEDFIGLLQKDPTKVNEGVVQRLLEVQAVLTTWLQTMLADPNFCPDVDKVLSYLTGSDSKDSGPAQNNTSADASLLESANAGPQQTKPTAKAANPNETIRVRSQKLDQLVQIIGELGIQQSMVAHLLKEGDTDTSAFVRAVNMVTKMSKEIQAQAIALRMQELKALFQRIERTGKEVAYELGKKATFIVEGSDLELDKIVLETITEPLIHIIRNAVDHGIETPDARTAAGKPGQANVWIQAEKETDAVRIIIKDDGKGIDPERVFKKAVEKGLIKAENKLSKEEILSLIFLPGFSTAEKITSVSGRGVGMDVVRQAIDSVGGRVEIRSEVGKGSEFILNLPTTMNIIDSIVVEVTGERFVLPLNDVSQIIDLQENELKPVNQEPVDVLKLRNSLIPIEVLGRYLSIQQKASTDQTIVPVSKPAIISGVGISRVAFAVDRVIGQQRVIVKSISGRDKYPPLISGATVLSDGRPGLIVAIGPLAEKVSQNYRKQREVS